MREKIQLTEPIGSWLVRHSCWQLFRFLVHSERHTTGFERVHGHPYVGAIVPFGEVVLARVHDDPSLGFHRYSKWDGRWQFGLWLGKSETTDEHLVACDGKVRKYRTVRRLPDNSPKKWSYELMQNLNATPWDTSGVTTATAPRMQTSLTRGEPPGIVGARARPSVAGCAACEHRGRASHGYRHSVVCQRTFARWLTSQTQAKPRADEVETAQEVPVTTPPIPRTRLRGKNNTTKLYHDTGADTAEYWNADLGRNGNYHKRKDNKSEAST